MGPRYIKNFTLCLMYIGSYEEGPRIDDIYCDHDSNRLIFYSSPKIFIIRQHALKAPLWVWYNDNEKINGQNFLTQNLFRIKEGLSSRVNLLYSGVIFHTKSCPLIRSFNNKERRGYHPLAYMTVYPIYSMGVKPRKFIITLWLSKFLLRSCA